MNRRRFFKTVVGAGVIAATPKPVLALLEPKTTAAWLGMEPLPLGLARLSTPTYAYPGTCLTRQTVERAMAILTKYYSEQVNEAERIYE